jgi:hypothetical protein
VGSTIMNNAIYSCSAVAIYIVAGSSVIGQNILASNSTNYSFNNLETPVVQFNNNQY